MIAKLERADDTILRGHGKTVKITIDGKVRHKNISSDISGMLSERDGIEVSDTPKPGFRKYKLSDTRNGFMINYNPEYYGYIFVCKRGMRDIGFNNNGYIYVKFGRKSRNVGH